MLSAHGWVNSVLLVQSTILTFSSVLLLKLGQIMTITRLETKQRMSRIVKHNGTIYLCGQVAADATKDITEQTQTMLDKVDALLTQAGSDREHILSATIYVKDMSYFAEMNAVWDAWVPEGHAPARACVAAKMAREALLVEISVVAAEK